MNNVSIMGRATRDAEVRSGENWKKATFTLAVDRGRDQDGNDRGADFIPVTVWRGTATLAEKYVKKGRRYAVNGNIETGSYERDGQTFYTWGVNGNRLFILDWDDKPANKGGDSVEDNFEAIDEDVPF